MAEELHGEGLRDMGCMEAAWELHGMGPGETDAGGGVHACGGERVGVVGRRWGVGGRGIDWRRAGDWAGAQFEDR